MKETECAQCAVYIATNCSWSPQTTIRDNGTDYSRVAQGVDYFVGVTNRVGKQLVEVWLLLVKCTHDCGNMS